MRINRTIVIIIITLILLALALYFTIPKFYEFKDVQAKLGEKEAEFNAKYAYYAEVSKIYRELQVRKENLDKIEMALPQSASFAPLIYFFQRGAAENGLIIKSMILNRVAPINPKSDIKEITFSLNVLGTYSALKGFISLLEKSARLFEITDINFSYVKSIGVPQGSVPLQSGQTYSFGLQVKTHSY